MVDKIIHPHWFEQFNQTTRLSGGIDAARDEKGNYYQAVGASVMSENKSDFNNEQWVIENLGERADILVLGGPLKRSSSPTYYVQDGKSQVIFSEMYYTIDYRRIEKPSILRRLEFSLNIVLDSLARRLEEKASR